MGSIQSRRYCPNCQSDVLAVSNSVNHVLHLLLSILTGGLWLLVWLLMAASVKDWRCSRCWAITVDSDYRRVWAAEGGQAKATPNWPLPHDS